MRRGFGMRSAGLPAYNLLIEGPLPGARQRRGLSMKQAMSLHRAAWWIRRASRRPSSTGPPDRDVPACAAAHSKPVAGWCELRGVGQGAGALALRADIDWSQVTEPDEIIPLLRHLGQPRRRSMRLGRASEK